MNRPICVIAIIYILIIVGLHNLSVVFLDYNKVNIDSNKKYIGIIVDEKEEKDYKNAYIIEMKSKDDLNNKRFIINLKKDNKLEFGDKISFSGEYIKPDGKRNYGGFDYSLYLKTQKIYGTFDIENYKIISKENGSKIQKYIVQFKNYVKNTLRKNLEKDEAELGIGIAIGDRSGISKEIENDFKNSLILF